MTHPTILEFESLFGEMEISQVLRAVAKQQDELATRVCPGFVGLPDIGVLIGGRVVAQAAVACGDCHFNHVTRLSRVTNNLLRHRIARLEDIQALVTTEAKVHWDALPRFDDVEGGSIVHWLEEAAKREYQLELHCADVTSRTLRSDHAALVGGGAVHIIGGGDGGAATDQGMGEGGAAIICQSRIEDVGEGGGVSAIGGGDDVGAIGGEAVERLGSVQTT